MDFDDIYSMDEPKEETETKTNTVEEKNTASDETKLTKSVSIYDSSNTNEENQNTETIENKTSEEAINYTFSTTDKKLSYIGNDSDSLPTEIFYQFGLKTLILDISFNAISDLRDLQQFPYLEELICDNNDISENSHFPKLESLKIFSCNKNHIDDIHIFIDKIKVNFPNLTYLSLLGNRACPNQLIDPNKDEYDYSRYRKYVLYRMKKLKFLDCYEVTREEREMIADDSLFLDVVTPSNQTNGAAKKKETDQRNDSNEFYTPLTALDANKSDKQETQGSFGYCRYIYYGKQSEGNRFIRNDDL